MLMVSDEKSHYGNECLIRDLSQSLCHCRALLASAKPCLELKGFDLELEGKNYSNFRKITAPRGTWRCEVRMSVTS